MLDIEDALAFVDNMASRALEVERVAHLHHTWIGVWTNSNREAEMHTLSNKIFLSVTLVVKDVLSHSEKIASNENQDAVVLNTFASMFQYFSPNFF